MRHIVLFLCILNKRDQQTCVYLRSANLLWPLSRGLIPSTWLAQFHVPSDSHKQTNKRIIVRGPAGCLTGHVPQHQSLIFISLSSLNFLPFFILFSTYSRRDYFLWGFFLFVQQRGPARDTRHIPSHDLTYTHTHYSRSMSIHTHTYTMNVSFSFSCFTCIHFIPSHDTAGPTPLIWSVSGRRRHDRFLFTHNQSGVILFPFF